MPNGRPEGQDLGDVRSLHCQLLLHSRTSAPSSCSPASMRPPGTYDDLVHIPTSTDQITARIVLATVRTTGDERLFTAPVLRGLNEEMSLG